jgi:two-component sensor histidine kinase
MRNLYYFLICFFLVRISAFGQPAEIVALEKRVYELNNQFLYDSSQALIQQFMKTKDSDHEAQYYGNLFLSYTYKRLYDYSAVQSYLDAALAHGLQTEKKDFFMTNVWCQKALAFFDVHKYQEADSLMRLLAKNNYEHLNDEYRAKIAMQEAYLLFLDKQYDKAEKRYDAAIRLLSKTSICDLPMIYAKKIELYGEIKNEKMMQECYQKSLYYADSCNIYKYLMYTTQTMGFAHRNMGDYRKALYYLQKYDSLQGEYNERGHLSKITSLDKKFQSEIKDQKIAAQKTQNYYLIFIVLVLVIGIILLSVFYKIQQNQKNIISQQNKVNEQLISAISHEIKEPLLAVSLLLKKLKSSDTMMNQASKSLENQVLSVNRILNSLLSLKKQHGSSNENSQAAVYEVILQVIHDLNFEIQKKNIEISLNITPSTILALPTETARIILNNLIFNAIKYSFIGGKIRLYSTNEGIFIQDFGTGIDEQKIPLLLNEAVISSDGTLQEKGSGLGLYIMGQMLKNSKIRIAFERGNPCGTIAKIISI